jgi:hypothetical protein
VSRLHFFFVSIALFLIGSGVFLYKWLVLEFPLTSNEESENWVVESRISFVARNRPVKVDFFVPKSNENYLILEESFVKHGFGLSTFNEGENRRAIFAIRKANGLVNLYYRAIIVKNIGNSSTSNYQLDKTKVSATNSEILPEFEREAVASILSLISSESADIESFTVSLLKHLAGNEPNTPQRILLGRYPTPLKRVEVARMILNSSNIESRIIRGVLLKDGEKSNSLAPLLEVKIDGEWRIFDPVTAEPASVDKFFPWARGEVDFATVEGADRIQHSISVKKVNEGALQGAIKRTGRTTPYLVDFSLFSLPVEQQAVYRVLLLIPLGAFVVVILRNLIGIQTLGTFMPVLISLAFRETEALWGVIFFTVLISSALLVRAYLDHLRLLLVPRLASILTIIVILMALFSILTYRLGIERGLSVALFPMVIMTMVVERMSILWDERGALVAIRQCIITLIVSVLVYFVLTQPLLKHLFFVFPELLLVVLSCNILLGRYTGYRLTEIIRFSPFAKGV